MKIDECIVQDKLCFTLKTKSMSFTLGRWDLSINRLYELWINEQISKQEAAVGIDILKSSITEHLQVNPDYESYFMWLPNAERLPEYKRLYNDIPQSLRYPIMRNLWVMSEGDLSLDLYIEATKYRIEPLDISSLTDTHGYITVYRGVNERNEYYGVSWTTKLPVAQQFANRYHFNDGEQGIILMGKIKGVRVIDFITDRSEYEIICDVEDVMNVKEMEEYY